MGRDGRNRSRSTARVHSARPGGNESSGMGLGWMSMDNITGRRQARPENHSVRVLVRVLVAAARQSTAVREYERALEPGRTAQTIPPVRAGPGTHAACALPFRQRKLERRRGGRRDVCSIDRDRDKAPRRELSDNLPSDRDRRTVSHGTRSLARYRRPRAPDTRRPVRGR